MSVAAYFRSTHPCNWVWLNACDLHLFLLIIFLLLVSDWFIIVKKICCAPLEFILFRTPLDFILFFIIIVLFREWWCWILWGFILALIIRQNLIIWLFAAKNKRKWLRWWEACKFLLQAQPPAIASFTPGECMQCSSSNNWIIF